MKTTKRLLSFLLTLAMMFSVIAVAVIPTAAAEESTSTAVVVVRLNGTMVGLDGKFTVDPDEGVTVTVNSVKANVGWSSSFNPTTGEFFLFNGANDAHECILTLEVEISGPIGSEANITFEYEYDETMDDVLAGADRKQASKTVTLDVVDYADLIKQIKAAEDLKADAYVSMTPIKAPLAAAKNALYASYDQVAVTELAAALQNAIKSLKKNIDYTRLDAAIAAAEKLNKYAYEAGSWAVLETELADAKAMRAATSVTQQDVLYAAIDLEEATKNLVPASADIQLDALQALYNDAAAKVESDYEADSWAAFVAIRDEAKAIIDAGTAVSQLYVDDLLAALDQAMTELVPVATNTTELQVLIAQAEALDPLKYEQNEQWTAFEAALATAQTAVTATLQSEVDAAFAGLKEAMDALTAIVVDYDILDSAIAQATALVEADYTAESWANLTSALEEANAAKEYNDQYAINAAAYKLLLAIATLVEKTEIDYTQLNAAISAAEGKTEAEYTADSWSALQTALNTAKGLTASQDQDAVTKAAYELELAIAELEKKPVSVQIDYSKLDTEISAAEALTEADYTADSWAVLAAALNAAKAAKTSDDQRAVDAAAYDLAAAVAALVKTPAAVDYAALNAAIAAAEALVEADYTAETWSAMTAALEAAKALVDTGDQASVDAAAHALELAVAKLEKPAATPSVEVDYSSLNAAIAAAEALVEADYTAETWAALTTALTAAKNAQSSDDQAAVASAAQALIAAVAALRTPVVTVPGESETVIVEPTDPFCNKGSHAVWPVLFGIFLALTVALAALIVVYLILKKKKENDDTPVVDYDIDEDEADEAVEAEEAAEESAEESAAETAEEAAEETEVFADDEAENTAE